MNRIVLITGAHGFVGRNVGRCYADNGWYVIGLGHGEWSCEEWKSWGLSEWHSCDISLEALMDFGGVPNVIVHCAGSGSVGLSIQQPYNDYKRTVETTINILEFVRLRAPKAKLVYPSSAAVYGATEHLPITTNCPLLPVSPYGVHKKIAEDLCRSYAYNFEIEVAIVRMFSVCGSGLRKQLMWDACTKILKNDLIFMGTGEEKRDWIHVLDASKILYLAHKYSSIECPVVNAGSGQGVTVQELLEEITRHLKVSNTLTFNGVVRIGDPINYIADNTSAMEWGWSPEIGWMNIVQEYVEWVKEGAK